MSPKLILIRGLPGSGKTTLAKSLIDYLHYEADMFFMRNGIYNFSPKDVPASHEWCYSKVSEALNNGKNVVVSNTFVCRWELEKYFNLGFSFEIRTVTGTYNNCHGATVDLIERMRAKWENVNNEIFIPPNHFLVSQGDFMKAGYD